MCPYANPSMPPRLTATATATPTPTIVPPILSTRISSHRHVCATSVIIVWVISFSLCHHCATTQGPSLSLEFVFVSFYFCAQSSLYGFQWWSLLIIIQILRHGHERHILERHFIAVS